jgi:hypothetical protein
MESIEESKAAEQSCGTSDESKAKAVATSETIEAFSEKKKTILRRVIRHGPLRAVHSTKS